MAREEYETSRSRRLAAVEDGQRETAVDRRRTDAPRGQTFRSRNEQNRIARDIASEIDVDRSGIGTVNRTSGLDVFLRSSGEEEFSQEVRQDFASEADFVSPGDVRARVDPEEIDADPTIPSSRRDDVAARARQESAANTEFIQRQDLQAEVSSRGVESLGIADDRRDDVRQRTRQELASENQFLQSNDFEVDVGRRGVEEAGVTEQGARRGAAREFESETALSDVAPSEVVNESDGFELGEGPQRELAAREFENETELSDVSPSEVVPDPEGDGFGLGEGPQRELAAREFEDETALSDVKPGALRSRDQSDEFTLSSDQKRRSAARRLETEFNQFGDGTLDPTEDIRKLDDGFGLSEDPARDVLADRIDEQTSVSVSEDDISIELNEGEYEAFFEQKVEVQRN